MNADTIVSKAGQHIESAADGDVVLMHIETGRFFSLSGTGRRVWALMDEPIAIGALVDRLTGEFAVPEEVCLQDILDLCGQLRAGQLVHVSP